VPPAGAPAALIDGRPASLDEAIDRAAELLAAAHYPFIDGLERLTCESQREAVSLADRVGASVNSCAAPGRLLPDIGAVTCTLGEIKNRADAIIYFGGAGKAGKLPTPASCWKEHVSPVAGGEFAAIWALRAVVRGTPINPKVGLVAGISVEHLNALGGRLKEYRYGVLVLPGGFPTRAVEAVHGLATDLNNFTRCHVVQLGGPGNTAGAEQVLAWQTGYGGAVGLNSGFPRSFGEEYSAQHVLRRGESDLIVRFGNGAVSGNDKMVPVIVLSSQIAAIAGSPAVAITTIACAPGRSATAFRFDGLALPLRPTISSSFPDDFKVLKWVHRAIRRIERTG
jgi:formylmethanofuran dehydrogenase subunit B